MASFTTLNAYDANTVFPEFRGLNQYGNDINGDLRYAGDAVNVEPIGGALQPVAACTLLTPSLNSPIETLARLYRRWHSGTDKENLVAASGGKLYYMLPTPGRSSHIRPAYLPIPAMSGAGWRMKSIRHSAAIRLTFSCCQMPRMVWS